MRKTFLYTGVGFLAFLIGLGIVYHLAFRPSYDLGTGRNVCQKCLDVAKGEDVENKMVAELFKSKEFIGKKIYLNARFVHDAGYIFLQDLENKNISIPAGFDKNSIPCGETEKTLQVCTGFKTWYDSSVEVKVVGYLGKVDKEINSFQGGEDGFNIICVTQVAATDDEIKRGKTAFENNPFSLYGILFGKN